MSGRAHALLGILSFGTIVFILWLVRRDRLRAKYSMLWLSIGVLMGVLAAVPRVLDRVARVVGISYPPAVFFLAAIAFLFLVVVHFSWELSRLENRARILAEEVAMLRRDLDETGTGTGDRTRHDRGPDAARLEGRGARQQAADR